MKIAYVHILPIEYYPPATNAIRALAAEPGMEIKVWTSANHKQREPFALEGVTVERPPFVLAADHPLKRMWDWFAWNWACARGLNEFQPDVVFSIEPHSAAAPWLYYKMWRGRARLFIHHHEYYAPADYRRPGNRLVNIAHRWEQKDLFARAEWISQTNDNRLRLLKEDHPATASGKFHTWPNYPPREWLARSRKDNSKGQKLRLVYLGSASFHDTYIREIVEWAAKFPDEVELTISGYNIERAVWAWLEQEQFGNVRHCHEGWAYEDLPERLAGFDIGLILYRANTVNFVYNAPNKLFEYWACGLSVWYPQEMKQITDLAQQGPTPPLKRVNFKQLDHLTPPANSASPTNIKTEYSCESALAPLLERLR